VAEAERTRARRRLLRHDQAGIHPPVVTSGPPPKRCHHRGSLGCERRKSRARPAEEERADTLHRLRTTTKWADSKRAMREQPYQRAAAGRLCDICFVVFEGVVGPWFLPTFVRATGVADVHYVVLLPPLDICLERVRSRVDHGFSDLSVTHDMHQQFATATVDARNVIADSNSDPARLAELIKGQLGSGTFRYSPP
jgi:hypothetical protein